MSRPEITMRAKAFSSERAREYKMIVDTDGSVRVYDSVAGHYTRVHSLSDSAKRRARKLAAEGVTRWPGAVGQPGPGRN